MFPPLLSWFRQKIMLCESVDLYESNIFQNSSSTANTGNTVKNFVSLLSLKSRFCWKALLYDIEL